MTHVGAAICALVRWTVPEETIRVLHIRLTVPTAANCSLLNCPHFMVFGSTGVWTVTVCAGVGEVDVWAVTVCAGVGEVDVWAVTVCAGVREVGVWAVTVCAGVREVGGEHCKL